MDDGDGENGPRKRCRIAAASTVDNGQTGDNTGHYIINADEIDDNGNCTGEDLVYYYSDDDAETEVDDANAVEPAEERYIVLSQDDIGGCYGPTIGRYPAPAKARENNFRGQ
ncbi:unnamed protein product [Miscanthus lutarioriparius]|uniref:Uncharacterized protein n=1 Tax=Miscanthus lutarioriparius TaxID=422564 RepID=A0A811QJ01_9POAL|nr:unnamed protein product [Miscanthus lutarioriparius]